MLQVAIFIGAIVVLAALLLLRAMRVQNAVNAMIDFEKLKDGVAAVDREIKARSCSDAAAVEHLAQARQCLAICEEVINMPASVLFNPIEINRQYTRLGEQSAKGLQHLQSALDISRQTNKTN